MSDDVLRRVAECADGDARMALNLLDACCSVTVTKEDKWAREER